MKSASEMIASARRRKAALRRQRQERAVSRARADVAWISEDERALSAIEDAKLVSMFGPKASYDDDEVRAMIAALG